MNLGTIGSRHWMTTVVLLGAAFVPLLSFALPQVSIATVDIAPIMSKADLIPGHISIDAQNTDENLNLEADMKIRMRGNSTGDMPKQSYRLRLTHAKSVLGMPADKDWILLANYSDKTLMRTYLAFEMSRRLDVAYTPRSRYVDLFVNGTAMGNYLLVEQIHIGPERVNASRDAFLLELDQRRDGPVVVLTQRNVPYNIKSPAVVTPEKLNSIHASLQEVEDVLNSDSFADPVEGYAKYIDVDSFVNIYLVQELFKNQDGASYSSIYLYKDGDQKIVMGPAWDFDIGAGNVNYSDAKTPTGWWIRKGSPWFGRLFEDPAFRAKVKARWNQVKQQQIKTLLPYADQTAYLLQDSQVKNFAIWDILNTGVWPNPVVMGSYRGEVGYLKLWLKLRIQWLDAQFNAM